MAEITTDIIKQLRNETGVSVMQCKKALEESGGDVEKAKVFLRKQSSGAASKKADRTLGAGIIRSYIHNNSAIGVLVELNCETDFVAHNAEFVELADNIAMHIAAMNPVFVSTANISDEEKAKITEAMKDEVASLDKPEDIKAKILEGKVSDYFKEKTLLEQAYIKNPDMTIGGLVEAAIQKIGEKIEVSRFIRYGVLEA